MHVEMQAISKRRLLIVIDSIKKARASMDSRFFWFDDAADH